MHNFTNHLKHGAHSTLNAKTLLKSKLDEVQYTVSSFVTIIKDSECFSVFRSFSEVQNYHCINPTS